MFGRPDFFEIGNHKRKKKTKSWRILGKNREKAKESRREFDKREKYMVY